MDSQRYDNGLLSRAAARMTYPATPDLRTRVLAALTPEAGSANGGQPTPAVRSARLVWLSAAAAVVAIAIAAALPGSRGAIADFFGIAGSEIELLPTPPLGVTPTPFPPEAPLEDIGTRVSLEEAERLAGFALALPRNERSDAAFIVRYGDQIVAVLRFERFDLWEARLEPFAHFGKGAPSGVTVEDTLVAGRPARWVSGGTHFMQYVDASGSPVEESLRTVERNTLIWNDGATFFRMETDLPLPDALEIAESLP